MLNRALLPIAMIFTDHKCPVLPLNDINFRHKLDQHHLHKTVYQDLHSELQKKTSLLSNSTSKRLI